MATAEKPTGNTVFMGIDFGTTYCGVGFTWSDKIERIGSDRELGLGAALNLAREKGLDSHIIRAPKNEVNKGYSIPFDAEQVNWFKLLLVDKKDLWSDVREPTKIKEARA